MANEFYEASAAARDILDRAESALPGLLELMWSGPEEELQLTANQQPALVAAGVAAYAAYLEAGGEPAIVGAGHSLGEYTALVASGSLALEDAVRLVRARGRYMQEAVPEGDGAMAAILKLDADVIERVALEVSGSYSSGDEAAESGADQVVEIANYNAPGQTVLSGSRTAVAAASAKLKELGGRVIPLKVSAPFHCSLMRPAAERLAVDLAATKFSQPRFPIICNVTARPLGAAADAAGLLEAQVTSSVRWVECVRQLASFDASSATGPALARPPRFIEFGAGEVLSNLVKRILPAPADGGAIDAHAIYDVETLEEVVA